MFDTDPKIHTNLMFSSYYKQNTCIENSMNMIVPLGNRISHNHGSCLENRIRIFLSQTNACETVQHKMCLNHQTFF